ncbi:MAG: porin family protein [Caulobacter sp.]|nr:porin family protein [Caulobacter sp.]
MKKLMIAVAAIAVLASPALAHAESNWYADIGYTNFSVDELDVNLGVVQGRAGVLLTPNFGLEGELGFGVAGDTVDVGGTPVDIDMNSLAAAYVVLNWPVSDRVDIYMRAGYATFEVKGSSGGASVSDTGSDSAVGIGMKAFFTAKDGVRADWTDYGGTDSFSVAYVRRF